MNLLLSDELTSLCPSCKNPRTYKTKNGWKKGLNKPCRSCSNSLSRGGIGNVFPLEGRKICFACKKEKDLTEFTQYADGHYHSYCNECKKESFRTYQKTIGRFARYGLTREEYEKRYDAQDGKCAICHKHFEILCIDHEHNSSNVRGLLCRKCNAAIGALQEDVEIVESALNYLKKSGE